MKSYSILFIGLVAALSLLIFFVGGDSSTIQMRFGILAYFSILTLIFHIGMLRSAKGDAVKAEKNFIRYYMAATTFKLLIHLGVILGFAVTHKLIAVQFIISFMVCYAAFTVFEVSMAMKKRQ